MRRFQFNNTQHLHHDVRDMTYTHNFPHAGTPGTPTTTTTTTTARPASLAGTHAVLLRLLGLLPPDKKSPHHTRVRALAGLCSELLQALAPPGDTVAAAITGP